MNHAVASIVVYFEHIMPKDKPVYKEWYEQWLAIKIAEHSKRVISRHDGSLIPVVAAPVTTVDLWIQ